MQSSSLLLSVEEVKLSLQNLNVYPGKDMMMICLYNKVSRSGSGQSIQQDEDYFSLPLFHCQRA